jgi:hypothetical protein
MFEIPLHPGILAELQQGLTVDTFTMLTLHICLFDIAPKRRKLLCRAVRIDVFFYILPETPENCCPSMSLVQPRLTDGGLNAFKSVGVANHDFAPFFRRVVGADFEAPARACAAILLKIVRDASDTVGSASSGLACSVGPT